MKNTLLNSRLSFYLAYTGSIGGVQLLLFRELFVFPGDLFPSLISQVVTFHNYFFDFLFILLIGSALVIQKAKAARFIGYTITGLYFCANFIQLGSYYEGGEFLSKLALENINHISLILRPKLLGALFLIGLLCLALPYYAEKKSSIASEISTCRKKRKHPISMLASVIIATLILQQVYTPEAMASRAYSCAVNNIPENSPVRDLLKTLFTPTSTQEFLSSPPDPASALNFGFHIDPNSKYPLVKKSVYKGEVPFPLKPALGKKPNIIVFFVEGLSARTIGYYNSRFGTLTPNITRFANGAETMVVRNYFSHTAATYRGLHGQLCSLYPTHGGANGWDNGLHGKQKSSYFCLSNYLNQLGYETVFVDPHLKDSAYIDELMEHIGFKTVITAEYMSAQYLKNAEPLRDDSISDQQLFTSLIKMLSKKEARNEQSAPFFIGIYNLETHAWRDIVDDGVPFRDGGNNVLNTIHNFDNAFGRFLDYFESSSLAKNTIIILTADHARYPDKAYTSALEDVNEPFQRVFFDRIPLILRSPVHQLPKEFDANFSTSLDFTPSLIHLLGFPADIANPFLGTSIFEIDKKKSSGTAIASIGNELYLANKDGVFSKIKPGKQKRLLQEVDLQVRYFKSIEESNRLYRH